jgi:hypothetical protein
MVERERERELERKQLISSTGFIINLIVDVVQIFVFLVCFS